MPWYAWVFVALMFFGWMSLAASVTSGKEKKDED